MTCRDLMTAHPAFCVAEDNVVRAAMLMQQHDVGSVPVVADPATMKLIGIVTDRDIALRVVAEQRDYYQTRIAQIMSEDLVTCREDDDSAQVLKAMSKKQIRRIPVVGMGERLVGIISQADMARQAAPAQMAESLTRISEPAKPATGPGMPLLGLLIAGGLGVGAGLFYLLEPLGHRGSDY